MSGDLWGDSARPMYYDRQGNPIGMIWWAHLLQAGTYKIVAQDRVGGYWVSTVWLGLDHSFGDSVPLTFETMIFREDGGLPPVDYQERYPNEEAARAGHDQALAHARELTGTQS